MIPLGMHMNDETVESLAKVIEATSETAGKLIEATKSLGRVFKGPVSEAVGILEDRIRFARWERQLALFDKARRVMAVRGLTAPTRELPLNFVVPLLTAAALEEDDELQETWARLLVNAGDAATDMELRTAYVEILRGMSSFDIRNLSMLAEATVAAPSDSWTGQYILTTRLPHFAEVSTGSTGIDPPLSEPVSISLSNLIRLGCIAATGGFGGGVSFQQVLVTGLGLALYRACA